jgi:hypothetical protein
MRQTSGFCRGGQNGVDSCWCSESSDSLLNGRGLRSLPICNRSRHPRRGGAFQPAVRAVFICGQRLYVVLGVTSRDKNDRRDHAQGHHARDITFIGKAFLELMTNHFVVFKPTIPIDVL